MFFSPMYSVQYSIYLYFLSKALQKVWGGIETDAVYYLNKVMHSIDWFYGIDLPDIFYEEHPLGSVLGRTGYGHRFMIYQGRMGEATGPGRVIWYIAEWVRMY